MNTAVLLEPFVARACEGDEEALEAIVRGIQDRVYNLALRMLWHPSDAEDATQEILLKVVTRLNQFRSESAFMTWVYQIATNHLLTTRRRRSESRMLTFEMIGDELAHGDTGSSQASRVAENLEAPDQGLLVQEVQLRCTLGMLLCLDREQRIAYILSEIFLVSGAQGAEILALSEVAFRKRVSRARARLQSFMELKCSLVGEGKVCGCVQRLDASSSAERHRLANLLTTHPLGVSALQPDAGLQASVAELERLERVSVVFRNQPFYAAPERFVLALKQLLTSGTFQVFDV